MNFKDATLLRQAALVGRDWIEVRSDNAIAVDNPATGEVIGSVPDLGSIETKRAIAAAEVAQKEWALTPRRSGLGDPAAMVRAWRPRWVSGWVVFVRPWRLDSSCNDPS